MRFLQKLRSCGIFIIAAVLASCFGLRLKTVVSRATSHQQLLHMVSTETKSEEKLTTEVALTKAETKELFEGNPIGKMLWDWLWRQNFMKPSDPGASPTSFGDAATVLRNNIEQVYGGAESIDGAPIAEGEVKGMLEGSLFLGLQSYYEKVSMYELLQA